MSEPIRLLLIEDNEADAALVSALLREGGHEYLITGAASLANAMEHLAACKFDVALVDFGLPDSVGADTVAALAACAPALPLVVLTGWQDDELGQQAILRGAEDYLVKGESSGSAIARTLRHAIERKRLEIKLRAANETLEACVAERTLHLSQALRAAQESEQRYRALTEAATEAIITTDGAGLVVDWNPAAERIFGYPAAEALGRHFMRLVPARHHHALGLRLNRLLADDSCHAVEQPIELEGLRKSGQEFALELLLARWQVSGTRYVTGFVRDITRRRQTEAALEFHTSRDPLTGLPNRALLYDRAAQALAYGNRYGHPVWIVCLNLDRFTLIASALGLRAGDRVLKATAERLSGAVRESDTVARVGTDEFMLVLPERSEERLEPGILQRFADAVARPIDADGQEIVLTCGIGVAAYPADGADAETLFKHAGIAMQRAKELGSNRFQFYAPAMNDRALDRLRMLADLREALAREEFVLHYQPQVDFRSGRVVGMEALIRWNHPQQGLLPPARFIGPAEESGLIVPIGAWVARAAAAQCKRWQDAGLGRLRVAINLSVRQFASGDLVRLIVDTLRETGLEPDCLEIELTESAVIAELERSIQVMDGLKALGVKLAIDDFGTGYSSLAYLKDFPIDALKIDRSFVTDIESNRGNAAIARAIISMAHALGMRVVAEGVETEAQWAFLAQNRCDELQGYLFSRPLAPQQFEQLLRDGRGLPEAPPRPG